MSKKEFVRRKILKHVMKKAWYLFKHSVSISFSVALKLSWRLIRGFSKFTYSKLRGVTYGNKQAILKKLSTYPKDKIFLDFVREPQNKYDCNAIKIVAILENTTPIELGYLSKELAGHISPLLSSEKKAVVIFDAITGLSYKSGTLGLNFSFIIL